MSEAAPNWIDAPEFQWTPERPFCADDAFLRTAAPEPAANDDAAGAVAAGDFRIHPPKESFEPAPDAAPAPEPAFTAAPEPAAQPAARPAPPDYLLPRLIIAWAQGAGLFLLIAADASFASQLGLVLLLSPMLLLTGLGSMPGKFLLPWTVVASVGLALLGAHLHSATIVPVIVAGLFLFIGQTMVMASARGGAPVAPYSAYRDAFWTLALQWVACIAAAFVAATVADGAFVFVRDAYPAARSVFVAVLAAPLCMALISWLLSPRRLQVPVELVQKSLTFILPAAALLAAATGVAGFLMRWDPPLLFCLGAGYLLLLCLNASYADQEARPRWREVLESVTAITLAPLVLLGGAALGPRVAEQGWSGPRGLAAASLALLAGYAGLYTICALNGLLRGNWRKQFEQANLAMAIAALALLTALALSA